MPWSAGTFTRSNGVFTGASIWQNDRDAGTKVTAAHQDTHDQDLATGINATLCKDGSNSPSANLPMATFKHTGVGNAAARDQYAAAGQIQDSGLIWVAAGGTADVITATLSPAPTVYANGMLIGVRAGAANTSTTPTLNVNGIGATTITKSGAVALVAGDIIGAGHECLFRYNSSANKFELLNPAVQSGGALTVTTTRGDIIARGASIDARLAIGSANTALVTDGTDPSWAKINGTHIRMGSDAQGDVLYFNGTDYVRLGPGTSGQFLKTNGAAANPAWATAGAVVQTVTATPYTTNADITTAIPVDNTIPQNTEGVQILTVSITPTSASNKVRLRFFGTGTAATGDSLSAALFVDSTANALIATWGTNGNGQPVNLSLEHVHSPGDTSAHTYNLRVGGSSAGAARMNGTAGGRIFGGVAACTLIAEEVTG